jgi:predicted phosphodiesterase
MVVMAVKKILTVIMLVFSAFIFSCEVDLLGFFGSTDLDARLAAANEFNFVKSSWRTNLDTGSTYDFIVLSDTHIIGNDANGFENLKSVLNGAKFVVVTGDLAQSGARQEIERFIEIANGLEVPCFPVVGNHDIFFGNWSVWRDLIGSTRYRVDSDSTTLIFFDTANEFIGDAQLEWLDKELRTAKKNIFLFTHANPFAKATITGGQQETDYRERARLITILKDRCDIYFSGHIHEKIIQKVGTTEFATIDDFIRNKSIFRVHVNNGNISYSYEKL